MRQRGFENAKFIGEIVFHSNDSIREMEHFLRSSKHEIEITKNIIEQAFKKEFLLVGYVPFLYLMIESNDENVVQLFVDKIKANSAHKNHLNMDMHDRCAEVLRFAEQNFTI